MIENIQNQLPFHIENANNVHLERQMGKKITSLLYKYLLDKRIFPVQKAL